MSAGSGPRTRTVVAALLRKELRVELRTFESIPAMTLFSVSTYVLFHFGLQKDSVSGDLASGVLWVTLLFAAVLAPGNLPPHQIAALAYGYLAAFGVAQTLMAIRMLYIERHAGQMAPGKAGS